MTGGVPLRRRSGFAVVGGAAVGGSDGAAAAAPEAAAAGVSLLDVFEAAAHDEVTGILLRREWRTRAERELTSAAAVRRRPALLMFDLDRFKHCNDQFGHAAGDLVLGEVVWAIRRGLGHVDLLGRLGGDELVVLLADNLSPNDAEQTAQDLRARIEDLTVHLPASVCGRDVDLASLTVSVGVAIPRPGTSPGLATLLGAADTAMYAAKAAGRNTVRVVETSVEGGIGIPIAPRPASNAGGPR